jgi:transcriptional regulator with XRE-family HTH domain
MVDSESVKRIKELRIRKGLSQEKLAELSGLSVRTIQRIENGETEARGESLIRLSKSLEVSTEEILDRELIEDESIITIMNLSQFGFFVYPLLGAILPFIIWYLKKNKVKDVNKIGKMILNFQITWLIGLFIIFIGTILRLRIFSISIFGIIGFMGIYLFNFLVILINTIKYKKGMDIRYRPSFAFLK